MEIKLTDEQIKALQAGASITIKAPCKQVKPWPQPRDEYWSIEGRDIHQFCHTEAKADYQRISIGNTFKTRKEAEQALKLTQAKQRLKQAIAEANDGWRPDWGNTKQYKYLFVIIQTKIIIDYYLTHKHQPNWMYMKSPDVTKQILAYHKADIELILSE